MVIPIILVPRDARFANLSLGAAIPFGRSLTYRFAFAGFWSAAAFAEVELPTPVQNWGVVKGLLLRHFRWWGDKHDMLNVDGTLTIGFTYPNMYMSEDYNSPQSPYWAMKSFVALGLPAEHGFWRAEETTIPQSTPGLSAATKPPMHILCNTGHHHFLLSMGQFCPWPLKATEAKYGKFAYSSHFGFSVPTGSILPQLAPDSTITLSRDGGEAWRVPWKFSDCRLGTASLVKDGQASEEIPMLTGSWKPWKDAGISVRLTVIAPCSRWPDWCVTRYIIENTSEKDETLDVLQGGFSIQGREDSRGGVLPCISQSSVPQPAGLLEGTIETQEGSLVCSNAGASGMRWLRSHPSIFQRQSASVLKPDANTNLIWQRTLIPTLRQEVTSEPSSRHHITSLSGVFALGRKKGAEAAYDCVDVMSRWEDFPKVLEGHDDAGHVKEYILVD